MRAKVRSIDLIDFDDWEFSPGDAKKFCVAAEALIGPTDQEGADIFSFEICTPEWFAEHRLGLATFARHMVFVSEYGPQAVKDTIVEMVDNISGSSWVEIATKIGRYLRWEFEDYQPTLVC